MTFNVLDKTGKTEFPFNKQVVFRTVCLAIENLKGMVIEHRDDLATQIDVKVGVSAFSWGEKVKIVVTGGENHSSELFVQSAAKTMLGAPQSKNFANIHKIISLTSKLIDEHGYQWEEEMKLKLNISAQHSLSTKHSQDSHSGDSEKDHNSPEMPKEVISTATEVTLISFFEKIKYTNCNRIYLFPNIPAKLLSNAIAAYKLEIEPHEVVVLIDNTMLGSAKDGCLICQSRIIFRDAFSDAALCKYENINVIQSKDNHVFINGSDVFKFNMPDSPDLRKCFQFLNEWLLLRKSNAAAVVTESMTLKPKSESPNKVNGKISTEKPENEIETSMNSPAVQQLQDMVTVQENISGSKDNGSTVAETLIGFISSAIEQNKSKIIPFLKEKSGEISIFALRDDRNIEKLALHLYTYLPKVVQFALQEQVFVNFMKENRNKILEMIIPNGHNSYTVSEKEDSRKRFPNSASTKVAMDDGELEKRIFKIKSMQEFALSQHKQDIFGQENADHILLHNEYFFVLDNHINLVNNNLLTLPFMDDEGDFIKSAASAQFLSTILSVYCISMLPEYFIDGCGKKEYFRIAGVAGGYYERCAEISARDDIYYDRLDTFYRHITGGDSCRNLLAFFSKPMYEDHDADMRPRSDLIIEIFESEPFCIPKDITTALLNKTEEICTLWQQVLEEMIDEDEDDDAVAEEASEKVEEVEEDAEQYSAAKFILRYQLEDTNFFRFREVLPEIFRKQNVLSKNIPLYLGLYETALACATLTSSFDANSEELKWIVNNDSLLLESYRYTYCTATYMLLDHMSKDSVQEIIKPLLLLPYSFIALELEPNEKTLADVLNPQKRIMESGKMREFADLWDYRYNKELEDEENATYERFAHNALDALEKTYDSAFLYDYVDKNGIKLHKRLQEYFTRYAIAARKDINKKLITHYSK